jgi:subtilase family serine protease
MRYNVKRSVTPGGPYVTIAEDIGSARYVDAPLVNGTRYYYVVAAENNLGESGDSNEASAVPNIPPDLVVSSLTGPSVAGAGTAITMSVTTTNQGNGQAEPSVTRFYLSANTVLDAGDTPLQVEQAVPALPPGASSLASVVIEIPGETSTARYYVVAHADDDDLLFESSETNNTRARSVQVGPDLDVASFTVPSSAAAGATISVTDSVTNTGGSAAPPTAVTFFLSPNGSLGPGDVPLGGRAVPALAAGATNAGPSDLTIPSGTAIGSYFVIALADGAGAVVETSETNNTYARSIKIGNDLVVSALTVAAGGTSATLTATDTTTNAGAGAAPSSVTRFYLSSNSTFDNGDTPLDGARVVPPLAPGMSSTGNTTVTIPGATPAGSYYLIAKADADNALAETSETNNTRSSQTYVGSDVVVALTAPATGGAGAAIVVTDTTSNDGSGTTAASVTRFYLSSNSTWDAADIPLNGTHAVTALAAGTGHTASTTLTIPAGTATGYHYLIARADADNVVVESRETNNTDWRRILIGPNLDVSAFIVPAKSGAGLSLVVSDTTINEGAGSAAATVTRFYLSVNTSLDASDPLVGSRAISGLAPGQFSAGSTTLIIPADTSTGSYSVIARTDADSTVPETSETDNNYVRTVKIGPDLDVYTLTASASTVAAGAAVTVTDKIINDGGGQAGATATRFYLSTNTTFDGADVWLAAARPVPALAPAASSTGSTSVTIPAGTAAARYYILARADGEDALAETSETNNVMSGSIQVTAAP